MPENGVCVTQGGHVACLVDDPTALSVPAWLDKSFLEHAYGEYLGERVHIESLAIEPATAKGENYASVMFRIKSAYSTHKDVNTASTHAYTHPHTRRN